MLDTSPVTIVEQQLSLVMAIAILILLAMLIRRDSWKYLRKLWPILTSIGLGLAISIIVVAVNMGLLGIRPPLLTLLTSFCAATGYNLWASRRKH